MTNSNGATSHNTPPPVAALVEALEKIKLYVGSCAEGAGSPEFAQFLEAEAYCYSALEAHQQTAEDWEKVAAFFKAYLSLRDKEYLAIINSEKLIELQNELVAAEDALPQWAKDWALPPQQGGA